VLYVNDTRLGEIRAYDMRPTAVAAEAPLSQARRSEPGIADGMKVDREGKRLLHRSGGIHVIVPMESSSAIRIPDHCTNMPGAARTGARSTSRPTTRCSAPA